ncbi:MAG: winged helix DNA-binding domain-containing protein [Anaerolineae bacterium]|jgi:hypothetical protein|nr:winged helix DNA-binding domain-containing protein [Anaerolineae bacterium]
MPALRRLSRVDVRHLLLLRQHLTAAPVPDLLSVVRDLGCLQLDPISAVQRSHLLVLWSRLGTYDPAQVEHLLYRQRHLFEYWAHMASIVLTDDYPLFRHWMQRYPGGSPAGQRLRQFVADDAAAPASLQQHLLARLRVEGPLPAAAFEDQTRGGMDSSGWTSGRHVNKMLDYLWHSGAVMVAYRQGTQRFWDITERCLPPDTPTTTLSETDVVQQSAARAVRCLGVARSDHIRQHFTRGRYPGLPAALKTLVQAGTLEVVQVQHAGQPLPGTWYLHADDAAALEQMQAGAFQPKTTLLSPFDNLICDRHRLALLFDFEYRVEIYTPATRRRYGYYVLPILHGESLIGRMDVLRHRREQRLEIKATFAEAGAPDDAATVRSIRGAVEALAHFLGARSVQFGTLPPGWSRLAAD